MEILKLFSHPLDDVLIVVGFVITVYFLWLNSRSKAEKEAISNYKELAESQEKRINQLIADFKVMQGENHELRAQINQLIGENKALKDLLTYQDPDFKKIIKDMRSDMKTLAEQQTTLAKEFLGHAKLDDKRFQDGEVRDNEIITEIKANRDFYAKTIKELKK